MRLLDNAPRELPWAPNRKVLVTSAFLVSDGRSVASTASGCRSTSLRTPAIARFAIERFAIESLARDAEHVMRPAGRCSASRVVCGEVTATLTFIVCFSSSPSAS